MRRRRYGGGRGGWKGLDAGAMSAHISPGRARDRLLLAVPPSRRLFICDFYCVEEMRGIPGSDGMVCILRPMCIFRIWSKPRVLPGVKQGHLPDRAARLRFSAPVRADCLDGASPTYGCRSTSLSRHPHDSRCRWKLPQGLITKTSLGLSNAAG